MGHNSEVTLTSHLAHHGEYPPLWIYRRRILIWQNVVRDAVDHERGIFDAVRIAARHTTKMGMLPVNAVVGGIVETHNNVALNAPAVVDE